MRYALLMMPVVLSAQLGGGGLFPGPGTAHSAGGTPPAVALAGTPFINDGGSSKTITGVTCSAGKAIAVFVQMPTGGSGTFPPTITDPASNTYTGIGTAQGIGGYQARWFVASNISALSSQSITVAPANNQFFGNSAAAICVSNISASPVDASATSGTVDPGAAGTSFTSAAFSTSVAAEAGIVGFGQSTGQVHQTITSGWTVDYDNAAAQIILAHQIFPSTQSSITVNTTVTTATEWTVNTIGLK